MVYGYLLGIVFSRLFVNLAHVFQIIFVTNYYYGQLLAALCAKLFDPLRHFLERILIGDVIHNESSLSASIVDGIQAMVLLLTRGVPYRELVEFVLV